MIQLVTAADGVFKPILEQTMAANERLGYKPWVYDLGGLGFGAPIKIPERFKGIGRRTPDGPPERVTGVAPWKPSLLLYVSAQEVDMQKTFVWLDADAWVIRPLDGLDTQDYDVAVTMRRPNERGGSGFPEHYGFLNTGVIAFRATAQACKFLKWVQLEVDNVSSKSDQHALNRVVLRATDLTEYDKVFELEDVRIKILKTEEYNNFYAPEEPLPTTRILHFKSDVRQRNSIEDWIRR